MVAFANSVGVGGFGFGGMPLTRSWYQEPRPAEPEAIVHLVDFEPEILVGISRLFAAAGMPIRVHADAATMAEAQLCDTPGCVVLRARCAQLGHLDFLADFQRRMGGVPVVLAADGADTRTVVYAMKAGAVDVVDQPFEDGDILEAVETAIGIDQRRRQADARGAEVRRRFGTLTPREREVMALVTQGRLNKQAAGDLGLSEITIKAHRGSAMRKMAARTIADLVRMADLLGGIDDEATAIFRHQR